MTGAFSTISQIPVPTIIFNARLVLRLQIGSMLSTRDGLRFGQLHVPVETTRRV